MTIEGRAPLMTDVARLAGVSHQTVSRVLNNVPHVRAETRERVLYAIRLLNYRPNALARGLKNRHARTIGVVSHDTTRHGSAATLLGIERAARTAGYGVGITTVDGVDTAAVSAAVHALADQAVAGIIVIAPQVAADTLRQLTRVAPTVTVSVAGIGIDQATGARLAVEHLLGLGHTTVWHLTGPRAAAEARARIAGWRHALIEAGVVPPMPITGDGSASSGYQAGLDLSGRSDVTAVFAGDDRMALGLMRAFAERGVRVPEDVSVVGFDDIPEAAYLHPPLTTVGQDFAEVGRRCVADLLHRLDPRRPAPAPAPAPAPIVPTLIVRRSTASRRSGT